MKTLLALAFALVTSGAALAETAQTGMMPMTQGTITKIDLKWKKITIDHGPLENLDMPGMKMVFDLADPAMLDGLAEGQAVTFVADRVNGKLTVTELQVD
ncbi:copper-binding protein [Maliponia aquimaris]|uniref:Periplasmic copper-binding protein n=1 Tax=Maliponia aquimaris TaxID=1673631 RepID=A0A238L4Y5_9RHOB|nr:copper-binding protein [Maliponia aquimaris]SMX49910.1 periplasmic copper-binding protein [Maliponia aquimaris]